jgi:hypothetical protein
MNSSKGRAIALFLALAGTAACGGSPRESPEETSLTRSAGQAFAESTCGTTNADNFLVTSPGATSPDGNYNHSSCTNAYIVLGHVTPPNPSDTFIRADYAGPITTPSFLGCNAMWAKLSVWKETSKGSMVYTKFEDTPTSYGVDNGHGVCLPPSAEVQVPLEWNYKALGQAGAIFTYEPVRLKYYRRVL